MMEIGMGLTVLGWWSRKAPDAPRPGFSLSEQGWEPERMTGGWLVKGKSDAQGYVHILCSRDDDCAHRGLRHLPQGPEGLPEDQG